jgi:UDP-N-acetylmuramate--alanine ligase
MDLDLSKVKNVHFIGIGGIGISAIARMMLHDGKKVTGQDMQDSEIIQELHKIGLPAQAGANIVIGQSYDNIPSDTDLIIYTIAIDTYDPELANKIKSQSNIPIRSYPQMLDIISRDKYTIAVSGTHGKTTTTAMIAQILCDTDNDPTVIVGSLLIDSKSNFIAGKSKFLVVEACEYRRSFLNINPKILVITNIDVDHLDYYKDIEDIKSAFHEMAMKVPSNGYVVCNSNNKNISDVIRGIKAKVVNYNKFFNKDLKLKIPGIHNKKDAAAASAIANILDIKAKDANKSLAVFPGTWRRFEFKGKLKCGAMVYDDYAHHPAEIVATLQGFRELYPKNACPARGGASWKITVVFQSHLFSRTKLLLSDFAKSFKGADEVTILPIYYAREEDDGTISGDILAQEISKISHNAKSFSDFESAERYLKDKAKNMNNKDIIITMGAGDAFKVGDTLINEFM